MNEKGSNKEPLGLTPLPDNTFEHDLSISDRYQSFSSELLRLSLLGIAVIGFLVTNVFWKSASRVTMTKSHLQLLSESATCIKLSIVFLGVTACCSLIHRYIGPDSIAFHLESLRRYKQQSPINLEKALDQANKRNFRFRLAEKMLLLAAISLSAGAIALAMAFIKVL
jgi:hypothetical protein